MNVARVLSPGLGMSFQDAGRPGWLRYGLPASGYMDHVAANHANLLVGNLPGTTVLEITLQNAQIEFLIDCWIAVTGGDASASIAPNEARIMRPGEQLVFPVNRSGVWIYVAIPHGWKEPKRIHSTSCYERGGIGSTLKEGYLLESNTNQTGLLPYPSNILTRKLSPEQVETYDDEPIIPLSQGPQFDFFSEAAKSQLTQTAWSISTRSDRTGYRLEGPGLEEVSQITSEPILAGTIQIPPDGQPIVTMPDGPTVGGYPKIAYMEPKYRRRLAQCRPGSKVRFQWIHEVTSS
ncbi:MAG: hypothetical protein AAF984_09035 [Verrucomicrobiota bacterium]